MRLCAAERLNSRCICDNEGTPLNYRIHPAAEMFPRMPGDEFVALKQDIRANGLIEPIWLLDDQILDGRHRYYACQEVGVTPSFREYQGDDAAAFVVSLNLKRRHLSESQRAAVAVRLANMPRRVQGRIFNLRKFAQCQANLTARSGGHAASVSSLSPNRGPHRA
jgi:hypothetical protein